MLIPGPPPWWFRWEYCAVGPLKLIKLYCSCYSCIVQLYCSWNIASKQNSQKKKKNKHLSPSLKINTSQTRMKSLPSPSLPVVNFHPPHRRAACILLFMYAFSIYVCMLLLHPRMPIGNFGITLHILMLYTLLNYTFSSTLFFDPSIAYFGM